MIQLRFEVFCFCLSSSPPLLLSFKEICALVRIFFRSQLNFPLCLIAFVVLSTDRKYTYASSPHPSTVVKWIHLLCDYTMMLKFILTPKICYSAIQPLGSGCFFTHCENGIWPSHLECCKPGTSSSSSLRHFGTLSKGWWWWCYN